MATFVVGDVHGCFATLSALLSRIGFEADRDSLWMVGDLVNRGPRSLEVLRWTRDLDQRMGERFVVVLGNHDLHFLARHAGISGAKNKDTLEEVLAAPDAEELAGWLRSRPLVQRSGEVLMVHAGLLPEWTPEEAELRARAVEARLQSSDGLEGLISREPVEDLELAALKADLGVFTRARCLTPEGRICDWSGPPEGAPEGCRPWFEMPGRRSSEVTICFGHWAALGLHRAEGIAALDSGCVWGHELTALHLETGETVSEPNRDGL